MAMLSYMLPLAKSSWSLTSQSRAPSEWSLLSNAACLFNAISSSVLLKFLNLASTWFIVDTASIYLWSVDGIPLAITLDASKVIASGIPSTDQRYIDAVSTINQVDAKFKNLSNTLEDIALKRQAALDGRDHSDGALDWEVSDHEDLANGTMYDNMVIQDDGGFNYNSNDGVTKRWADYSNTFQTSGNGNAGFETMEDKVLNDGSKGIDFRRNRYENQFDKLTKKLGTKGARDFVFADDDFIAQKTNTEVGTEEFENAKKQLVNKGSFDELKIEYKKYGVDELEKIHGLAKSNFDKMLNLKNPGQTKENNANIIKQFERGDSMVRLDEYNVAVKLKDGTYVTVKNNEVSLPSISNYQGRSANEYIQFLGGTITNTGNNILNDGNIKRSSGGNSDMKEVDVRDVQQIKG